MRLAFIGGGMMGEAMIAGAIANDVADAGSIVACDVAAARRQHLAGQYRIKATDDAAGATEGADIVVLAVKPQEFAAAAPQLVGRLRPDQTIMSIMAGVRIATINDILKHQDIVRAIPNTPATIGHQDGSERRTIPWISPVSIEVTKVARQVFGVSARPFTRRTVRSSPASSRSCSHSGYRLRTMGMTRYPSSGGGRAVAQSRVPAPHGSRSTLRPRRSMTHQATLTTVSRTPIPRT